MLSSARLEAADPIIRAATPADDARSLGLFNEVFHCDVKPSYWDWKYRKFPGAPLAFVAEESGRLVGHTAILPIPLNIEGKKVAAGHCVDSFVAESHRDQGLYLDLVRHNYEAAEKAGIQVYYGFPTAKALAIKVAKLGFRQVASLTQYRLRLDVRSEIERRLRLPFVADTANVLFRKWRSASFSAKWRDARRESPGIVLNRSARVPEEYESFWPEYARKSKLCLWKDATYLRWRYDQNPKGGFEYFWASQDNRVKAFAIACRHGEEARICELLVTEQDIRLARYLVCAITNEMGRDRMLRRLTFDGSDQGFFSSVFLFWKSSGYHAGAFATKWNLSPSAEPWSLSVGDGDTF